MNPDSNWRVRTMLLGGVLGALTGVAAAYLLIRRSEDGEQPPKIGAGEGVRLGLLLLGLLRQVTELGSQSE
ncbi:MAG TPA: hypothetical protein VGA07_02255 [Anaerolineales bacterium]